MKKVLIVFYSEKGSTQKMAIEISNGVNSISGVEAVIRTVPVKEGEENNIANENDFIYATVEDVNTCDAMIIGSPTHFGNMSSHLKFFLEKLTTVWFNGGLEGKPGGVFTSSNSIHGGQETTLITMMIPLLHLGMIICGLPYSEKTLNKTVTGGTPYGPSHVEANQSNNLSEDEIKLCKLLGKRIASLVVK